MWMLEMLCEAYRRLGLAKREFENVGWRKFRFNDTGNVFSPSYRGNRRYIDCKCLVTAVDYYIPAVRFIRDALGLEDIEVEDKFQYAYKVTQVNDSQPATEASRLWAINTVDKAMKLCESEIDMAMRRGDLG